MRKKRRSHNYIDKKELMAQILVSKQVGDGKRMNDELAKMLTKMAQEFAKSPQFFGYTFREDMQAFAVMSLVGTWYKFDENRSNNPFAFYTQCIKNSFLHFLKQEKKQRNIRDEILVTSGMNPSHTYMIEAEEKNRLLAEERNAARELKKEDRKEPLYE